VQRFDSGTAPVENAAEALSLYRVEVLVNWDDEATTARGLRLVSLRAAAAP